MSAAAGAADPLPFVFGPDAAGSVGPNFFGGVISFAAAVETGACAESDVASGGMSEEAVAAAVGSVSVVGSGGGGVASGAAAEVAERFPGSGEDGRLVDGLWPPASAACLSRSERDGMRGRAGGWEKRDG